MTDSEELYRKLVLFRSHGITRDPDLMTRNEGSWFYQQLDLGYNYRMTDIQCALGCSQMRKLDRFLARRREITKRYDEAFAGLREYCDAVSAAGDEQRMASLYHTGEEPRQKDRV